MHGVLDPLWVDVARGSAAVDAAPEAGAVAIRPNPAAAYVYPAESLPGAATYRCFDALGRLVATGTVDEQTRVETATWRPGLYHLEIVGEDRVPVIRRLMVERP